MLATAISRTACVLIALSLSPNVAMSQAPGSMTRSVDWEQTMSAARKEGRAVLYFAATPSVIARLKSDFENTYSGILVEASRVLGPAISAKIDQEIQTGSTGADVIITGEVVWINDRAKAGSFAMPAGPSLKAWPAGYWVSGFAPVLAIEPLVMVYNTALVKRPVRGYGDLLHPEFAGKIATTEPISTTTVAWYDWLEKTHGRDFLGRFAAQRPRAYVGGAQNTQAVASGEVAVSAFSIPTSALPLIAQGAPIKIVVPTPSLGFRLVGAIVAKAPRPSAALVLMDYLMSLRGQTVWNGQGESASPLSGVPGSLEVSSINVYDPTPYTPDFVRAYRERWNTLFKVR